MIPQENSRFIRSDKKRPLLDENGLILRKWHYLETRPFHQKPPGYKKGLFIIFDLSESSRDFSFLSWFAFSAWGCAYNQLIDHIYTYACRVNHH